MMAAWTRVRAVSRDGEVGSCAGHILMTIEPTEFPHELDITCEKKKRNRGIRNSSKDSGSTN